MGKASRARAEAEFSYDVLADRLGRRARGAAVTRRARAASLTGVDDGESIVRADLAGTLLVHRHRRAAAAAFFTTAWQWVGAITALVAVRDRRVRVPLVVLQRRPAQPHRRDLGDRAVPPARAADAGAGAPTMLGAARRQVVVAAVDHVRPARGPRRQAGSSLAVGFLVPMFGFGLNGLWAAYHGDFPRRGRTSRAVTSATSGQNDRHG